MIEPRETIKRLQDYKPPIDARLDKHRYDFNENVLGASPKAIEALRNIDPVKLSTYPEYEEYYDRIASSFGINPEQMMLSNGTDEAIKLILETYMEQGDEMLLPVPTFAMFKFYSQRIGISINEVLYNDDLSFPTRRVIENISNNTRMVVLVNPNNPTGSPIDQADIISIVEKASHCLVLIDEAYYDFADDNSLDLIDKYDNIIILRTFSKSIGLAGLRIGMAISQTETISILQKSSSPYNVSAIACHMAAAALEDKNYASSYVSKVLESRARVSEQLEIWGYKVYPSASNFLLVDFGVISQWIIRYLRSKDILVRDRSSYPLLKNCVRITMGDKQDADRLLAAIDDARNKTPIIFDMDGVLVDVSKSYRQAIVETVSHFTKYRPDMTEIQKKKNAGGFNNDWKLSQSLIKDHGGDVELDDVIGIFQEYYLGNDDNEGLILKESWQLDSTIIEKFHSDSPLFIFTGRPREEALIAVRVAKVEKYFDAIITMDDTPEGKDKPDPWGLNLILSKFANGKGYYFGDTVDDIKAAMAAGITPIGVKLSDVESKTTELLLKTGAEKVITIDQIMEVL